MSEPCLVEEYLSAFEKGSLLNIVACSGAKIWSKYGDDTKSYPARIAYQGGMFKQAVGCFENFKNKTGIEPLWLILSAKYGFIEPDKEITNYNISFSERKDCNSVIPPVELLNQWAEKELGKYSVIFVWGGRAYAKRIEEIMAKTGNRDSKLYAPAVGLPIGKAQQALKNFRIALTNEVINAKETNLPPAEVMPVITKKAPETKILTFDAAAPMTSKYHTLKDYLENRGKDAIDLSFSEIESILGFKLPQSAFRYPAWWSNHGHTQSFSWNEAGYETTNVDLPGRRVRFSLCNK
ncbi:MAG: hypothetical protein GXZ00_07465 [Synergistaceae bacterium]|nr:hypothetical protein [Synergistaceae bacterium]